jgi:uncharacterized protein (TIGR00255 family)
MRSMTGFGIGSALLGEGRLVVELKTVNHRFLEIRSRVPKELVAAEPQIEKLVRSTLSRGHCTIVITYDVSSGGAARLDTRALESYLAQLEGVASKTGVPRAELVPLLATAPNLYVPPIFVEPAALAAAVDQAFAEAASKLMAMREIEGRAMAADISARLSGIRAAVGDVQRLAAGYAATILSRTRLKVAALLAEEEFALETGRIEAEVALLADKADISEEITRLASHCDQMGQLLASTEPVGRRLDFLIQEMSREANTVGAKAAFAELTHVVIEFKAELEKIRELVQNVE